MARFSDEQKAMLDEYMHKKICEAASGIIVEYGIEKITMDKVAEAAGVAKGTIYNYFKDKNQLLVTIGDTVFDPVFKRITELADLDSKPLFKLEQIARIMLEAFSRHEKLFILLHEARISGILGNKKPIEKRNELISIVEKIIESGIKDGQLRASNPLIVAEIFLGMVMSINISKITTGTERPVQEDLDTVMSILTKGIQQNATDSEDTINEC
jgi:AcrR family transcriptional regulator